MVLVITAMLMMTMRGTANSGDDAGADDVPRRRRSRSRRDRPALDRAATARQQRAGAPTASQPRTGAAGAGHGIQRGTLGLPRAPVRGSAATHAGTRASAPVAGASPLRRRAGYGVRRPARRPPGRPVLLLRPRLLRRLPAATGALRLSTPWTRPEVARTMLPRRACRWRIALALARSSACGPRPRLPRSRRPHGRTVSSVRRLHCPSRPTTPCRDRCRSCHNDCPSLCCPSVRTLTRMARCCTAAAPFRAQPLLPVRTADRTEPGEHVHRVHSQRS